MAKYRTKSEVVEAYRYQPGAKIPGFTVIPAEGRTYAFLRGPDGREYMIRDGEWAIIKPDGSASTCPDDAFESYHEPA